MRGAARYRAGVVNFARPGGAAPSPPRPPGVGAATPSSAGGIRPPVDSHDPARISSSPATAPAPGRSPRTVTPSATATTGATYVITDAFDGPTSPISTPKK